MHKYKVVTRPSSIETTVNPVIEAVKFSIDGQGNLTFQDALNYEVAAFSAGSWVSVIQANKN